MKYAAIVTYTTGERTGATITAKGMADAWTKIFAIFDSSAVKAVEIAEILIPARARK